MARRRDDGELPVSSCPSSLMDDMMSSLLVWRDGQLVAASSAPSQDAEEHTSSLYFQAEGRKVDARARAASDQSRPAAGRARVSDRARPPRVKDVDPSRAPVVDYQKLLVTLSSSQPEVARGKTPTSTPCSAEVASQSEHSKSRARRAPTALQSQKIRSEHEACGRENIPPPSGQMSDPNGHAAFGLQDANMESLQSNQAFTFEDDNRMDLMSIEAWEKENPYSPPKPASKPAPSRKVIPARLERNHGKDTQIFNTECQRRGLTHEFRFEEVVKGSFDVTLIVEGQTFDRAGLYASKKDAKEAMSRLALGKISSLGFKNLDNGTGNSRKRKSSDLQNTLPSAPDGLEDENWIHIVNTYAQQNKLDYPDYEFSEEEPYKYTCTMGFTDSPLQAFGLGCGPFSKKDTAKKAAAMEAVKWLRAEGKLGQIDTKRHKSSARQSNASLVPDDNSNANDSLMDTDTPEKPSGDSIPQQVFHLARKLGFSQPQFHPVKREANFVDESATFMEQDVRYEPRLAGVHGQVHRIFGKKAAHTESCRLVLQLLKEIQRSRMG